MIWDNYGTTMGQLWDNYGTTKEQHRTGVKEIKQKRVNNLKKELKNRDISYKEILSYFRM